MRGDANDSITLNSYEHIIKYMRSYVVFVQSILKRNFDNQTGYLRLKMTLASFTGRNLKIEIEMIILINII